MKLIHIIPIAALLLSACMPGGMAPDPRAVEPPVQANTPTAYIPPIKEVVMATRTPVAPTLTAGSNVSMDPDQPLPTSTSVGLPKTLEELGVPAKTYQDPIAGLAFDYPADWIISSLPDADKQNAMIYSITLRSKQATRMPKQQEGVPPDMAAIDVTVFNQGPKTYEQAINDRRASAASPESGRPVVIASEEEWTLSGGLPAHRFLFNLGKDPITDPNARDVLVSELVTMINGKMILVSGQGNQSLFNVVASSLREIK